MYRLFDTKQIELKSTPTKLLYYKIIKKITPEDIDLMANEFNEIKEYKLQGLEKMYDVLQNNENINMVLKEHLGLKK